MSEGRTSQKIHQLVQTARLWLDDVYGDTSQSALDEIESEFNSLLEQLHTAETTLAHAEAFIEHMDMSHRWAEWCEGRDPEGVV